MLRYALIENGVVANVVLADPDVAESLGAVACPDSVSPGWLFSDGQYAEPPADTEAEAARVRSERNVLLAESDWTQLADAPLAVEQKTAWATYRQALRDITEQPTFPTSVQWPEAPQ